jgi:hypothetical protein
MVLDFLINNEKKMLEKGVFGVFELIKKAL